ncbi:hypothetical protein VOLCADRAFT_93043 [Volvox carteri f. nagariensis]|uniref:Uncharacterized protein n=1 Tax=Volvox carteri f. nagariensis TaxID=3068 RepID=D8U170_VOLCA|nr:uncharacterized protein VOLCADRAFT_93043 [Volvox carteri f. nagariensis]EFJ46582.1 hypothetical protein VOLCADRAFT_93043 [Volvox carteri f. nagariensis]|eukprot:XP_002952439.1 hypothetical protein VOLCADRAFT_93043 [Volvox carteri f. nagariensis]
MSRRDGPPAAARPALLRQLTQVAKGPSVLPLPRTAQPRTRRCWGKVWSDGGGAASGNSKPAAMATVAGSNPQRRRRRPPAAAYSDLPAAAVPSARRRGVATPSCMDREVAHQATDASVGVVTAAADELFLLAAAAAAATAAADAVAVGNNVGGGGSGNAAPEDAVDLIVAPDAALRFAVLTEATTVLAGNVAEWLAAVVQGWRAAAAGLAELVQTGRRRSSSRRLQPSDTADLLQLESALVRACELHLLLYREREELERLRGELREGLEAASRVAAEAAEAASRAEAAAAAVQRAAAEQVMQMDMGFVVVAVSARGDSLQGQLLLVRDELKAVEERRISLRQENDKLSLELQLEAATALQGQQHTCRPPLPPPPPPPPQQQQQQRRRDPAEWCPSLRAPGRRPPRSAVAPPGLQCTTGTHVGVLPRSLTSPPPPPRSPSRLLSRPALGRRRCRRRHHDEVEVNGTNLNRAEAVAALWRQPPLPTTTATATATATTPFQPPARPRQSRGVHQGALSPAAAAVATVAAARPLGPAPPPPPPPPLVPGVGDFEVGLGPTDIRVQMRHVSQLAYDMPQLQQPLPGDLEARLLAHSLLHWLSQEVWRDPTQWLGGLRVKPPPDVGAASDPTDPRVAASFAELTRGIAATCERRQSSERDMAALPEQPQQMRLLFLCTSQPGLTYADGYGKINPDAAFLTCRHHAEAESNRTSVAIYTIHSKVVIVGAQTSDKQLPSQPPLLIFKSRSCRHAHCANQPAKAQVKKKEVLRHREGGQTLY